MRARERCGPAAPTGRSNQNTPAINREKPRRHAIRRSHIHIRASNTRKTQGEIGQEQGEPTCKSTQMGTKTHNNFYTITSPTQEEIIYNIQAWISLSVRLETPYLAAPTHSHNQQQRS